MEQDYVLKLSSDLYAAVNNNPMPISVKYFIIKDFFNEVQMAYNKYCQEMAMIQEKEETKEVSVPVKNTDEEKESLEKVNE